MTTTEASAYDDPHVFTKRFLGLELHPGQIEILRNPSRTTVVAAGRGFGKSILAAVSTIHFAITHPGTKQLIAAPTTEQSSIIFDEIIRLLKGSPLSGLIVDSSRDPHPEVIIRSPLPGRERETSLISARPAGHDGRFLRGFHGDRMIVDEAAYVPTLVMQRVIPQFLGTSQYGERLLVSTPNGRNAFYELFLASKNGQPNVASFHYTAYDNPYINCEILEEQRRELPDRVFRVEYLAEFDESQGSVFSWDLIQRAVSSAAGDQQCRHNHRYLIGYDPARWEDGSALVVIDVTHKPAIVVAMVDLKGMPYPEQMELVAGWSQYYNNAQVEVDVTQSDFLTEQLERLGVNVRGFKFSNASKRQLIDGLHRVMERGNILIPDEPSLLRELEYYRFEVTAAGNVRLGAARGEHDDFVTALALAVHLTYHQHRDYVHVDRSTIDDYLPSSGYYSAAEYAYASLRAVADNMAADRLQARYPDDQPDFLYDED